VSASATGKGGVTVRFQGELMLARGKRGEQGDVWEVVEIGPRLVERSMGKTAG
jgi:hypothetical protein